MIDGRGIETTFRYDKENRRLETKRAEVVIETTEYDPSGNARFVTDANGHTTGFVYDERGLVLEENRPESSVTRHVYNEQGNRTYSFDPSQRETRFTYDLRNRQQTVEIEVEADRFAATTFSYDLNNQRLSTERPESGVQGFAYDDANRLKTVTATLLEAGGTIETGVTTYSYDKNSNLKFVDDAEGRRTEFVYDELTRRTERIYPQTASQPEPSRETWTYDENSNIETFTDAKGQVFESTWDALNRERQRTYPVQNPGVLSDHLTSMSMSYDGNHNLVQIDETYSETGLLTTLRTHDDFDRLESITDRWGQKLSYAYDANGNRTGLQAPDQTSSYAFDGLNRLSTVTTAGGLTTYAYHPNSRLKSIAYPNGTTADYTFDTANRLTKIEQRYGDLTIGSYDYRFDDNGNRVEQTESQFGRDTEITTYGYDLADRLDSVTYPDQSVAYDYDRVGNRQAEAIIPAAGDAFSKTYGYNTRDQLESIQHSLDPAETVIYTYDVNGNQLSKTKNGTTTTFIVNSRNQITRIEENGLPIGAYGYDYQGLRVRKYTDHEVRYLYDDQSVLQREDANEGTVHYEYGPDRLLSVVHPSESRSFYLHDALGSIVAMTGPGASLMGQYSYDAWGNYRHKIENQSNVFGFTGHEMDGESGLVYARARFYDPEVGRFLSHDPLEGDANNPPSLHRYLYAYQNPTVWVDPTGMSGEETPFFLEPTGKTFGPGEEIPEGWEIVREFEGGRIARPIKKVTQTAEESEPEEGLWEKATLWIAEGKEKIEAALASWGEANDNFDGATAGRRTTEDLEASSGGRLGGAEAERLAETTHKAIGAFKDTAVAGAVVGDKVSTASGAAGAIVWIVKEGVKRLVKRELVEEAIENGWRIADNVPRRTAKFAFDAKTGQYRDLSTGRFVSPADLPWPSSRGFVESTKGTLKPGEVVDRFGPARGRYAGQPGATTSQRGMASGTKDLPYRRYEVVKPIEAEMGPASAVPEFGAEGGATQYLFQQSISDLVEKGFLRELP